MPHHINRTNGGIRLVIRDIEGDLNIDLVALVVGLVVVEVVFVVVESIIWNVEGDFFGLWFRDGRFVVGYDSDVLKMVVFVEL